ncbi:hypothetical protein [Streptomyces sp. NPDC091027]|uniref:hypothetical protein n=1 Tax=Streptomyces sp. NPDC091027 TaxID=3365971 RepID=UPI0038168DB9
MQINEDEFAVLHAIADLTGAGQHGIPTEDDVAARTGMGHDEVVEIMRYLEGEGLIEVLAPTQVMGGATITALGRQHL